MYSLVCGCWHRNSFLHKHMQARTEMARKLPVAWLKNIEGKGVVLLSFYWLLIQKAVYFTININGFTWFFTYGDVYFWKSGSERPHGYIVTTRMQVRLVLRDLGDGVWLSTNTISWCWRQVGAEHQPPRSALKLPSQYQEYFIPPQLSWARRRSGPVCVNICIFSESCQNQELAGGTVRELQKE